MPSNVGLAVTVEPDGLDESMGTLAGRGTIGLLLGANAGRLGDGTASGTGRSGGVGMASASKATWSKTQNLEELNISAGDGM